MSIFKKKNKEEYVRHGDVQPTSSFEEELTAQLQGGQLLQGQPHLLGTLLPKVTSFQGCQDMATEGK